MSEFADVLYYAQNGELVLLIPVIACLCVLGRGIIGVFCERHRLSEAERAAVAYIPDVV